MNLTVGHVWLVVEFRNVWGQTMSAEQFENETRKPIEISASYVWLD